MIQEDAQQLFISLGLTALQAKVYIAVLNSGEVTAKQIAASARIDRPDTYRVIGSLVQQGFIEKEVGYPIRFKATPVGEVTEVLLGRKQQEILETGKKASEILRQFQNKIPRTENCECGNIFYNLLPGNHRVIDKASKRIIESSQKTLDFVSTTIYAPTIGYEPLEDFFRRGGTNRVLSYTKNDALAQKLLDSYKKGSMEIRYASKPSGALLVALIGDRKMATIVSKKGNLFQESECLFTNSPIIAELAANYFETLWNFAEKFPSPKSKSFA